MAGVPPFYTNNDESRLARLGMQMRSAPGFAENLALETWRMMPEVEQTYRLDAKEFAREQEQAARQEQYQFEQSEVPLFAALNEKDAEVLRMVLLSEGWTTEERQAHIDQGLLPYSINRLIRYWRTMAGEQMGQETQLRAKARLNRYDLFAQAVNSLLLYFDRRNDWKMQKHYVYRDGMVTSRGISGVRLDPHDPLGSVLKQRYRREEFIWHTRTAEGPRMRETKYFERIYYQDRAQMMVEFPEYATEISQFNPAMWGYMRQHAEQLDVLIRPRVQPTATSGNAVYEHLPNMYTYWKDTILRRDMYRRHPVTKYQAVDPYRKMFVNFDSIDQANAWLRASYNYWKNIMAAQGIDFEPRFSEPRMIFPNVLEKLTWAGSILLRVEQAGEELPFQVFAPEMIDGSLTSFFAPGIDAQRMQNRSFTSLEQLAGAAKGKQILNKWGMPPEMDDVDIKEILVSSTEPIIVNVPPGTPLNEIMTTVAPPSIAPAIEVLRKIAMEGEQQMFGGENFIGQQETSAESGKAVLARQTAANMALIPYEEELWAWEEQVGKAELKCIQALDPSVIQALVGESDPGLADQVVGAFLDHGVQSLREIDMEIELVETAASPSTKDRILSQISYIIGQAPATAPYWSQIQTQYMDIDATLRDQMLQEMQSDKQYQQQIQMMQLKHQQDMETRDLDLRHMDRLIKLKELEIKANPPWQKTLQAKLPMSSPAMIATVMNSSGTPADPGGVAQDMALGILMEQGQRDLQQEQRNKLLLPEERKALEFKAKQPYRNVPTAEDSGARSMKGK